MSAATARIGHCTSPGPRPANQDAAGATSLPGGREVVAVADGMGGHSAGEVASATAIRVLLARLEAGDPLTEAFRAANAAVHGAAERDPACRGMGTTLVAALRAGPAYHVANVGDSRAYRVTAAGIEQITRDHSFVAEAVRSGQLSREDAERSPWRNAVTRSLGTGAAVEADLFGPFRTDGPPHALVLCSDGIHKAVPDAAIRECILAADGAAAAARALAELALRSGSDDNVTVAVLDLGLLARRAAAPHAPAAAPFPWEGNAPAPAPVLPALATPVRVSATAPRLLFAPRGQRPGRPGRLSRDEVLFAACAGALMLWLASVLAAF